MDSELLVWGGYFGTWIITTLFLLGFNLKTKWRYWRSSAIVFGLITVVIVAFWESQRRYGIYDRYNKMLYIFLLWIIAALIMLVWHARTKGAKVKQISMVFVLITWGVSFTSLALVGLAYEGETLESTLDDINIWEYILHTPFQINNQLVEIVLALLFNVVFFVNFWISLLFLLANAFNSLWRRIIHKESVIVRNQFGAVYDSISKDPLGQAVIRFYDKDSNKMITTIISDAEGKFNVSLPVGTYKITVRKPGYVFPSQVVDTKEDPPWTKVIPEQTVAVTEPGDQTMAIPLDPADASTLTKVSRKTLGKLLSIIFGASVASLLFGTYYSIFGYAIWGGFINMLLVPAYMTLLYIRFFQLRQRELPYGKVADDANEPVPTLEIAVIEMPFNQLVQRVFTDQEGKFRFIISQKGNYVLKVVDPQYTLLDDKGQPVSEVPAQLDFTYDELVIHQDINVRKTENEEGPIHTPSTSLSKGKKSGDRITAVPQQVKEIK